MVAETFLLAGQIHPFLFVFPVSIFILPSHLPSSSSVSMNLFFKLMFFLWTQKSHSLHSPGGFDISLLKKLTSKWMTVHLCVNSPEMILLHLFSIICMMKTIGDFSQVKKKITIMLNMYFSYYIPSAVLSPTLYLPLGNSIFYLLLFCPLLFPSSFFSFSIFFLIISGKK